MLHKAKDYPYLNKPYPLAIAHRGGAGDWPENSFAAFREAYQMGIRYMETDVHLTRDGQVVAFHDPTLDRLGGESLSINQLNWAEIRQMTLQNGEQVPLLRDLLCAFPDAHFNIDMKCNEVVQPMIALARECAAEHRICLASFLDRRLGRVQREFKGLVCSSAGRRAVVLQMARSRGLPWTVPHAPVMQVPLRKAGLAVITEAFVNRCHRDGKHVHVWTIDDPQEMHKLLDLGVNGIVTDRPAVLKQVLIDRGQWYTG